MRKVRSTNTRPERTFAIALRKAGFTYRSNDSDLPGKPDIVIPNKRLAVFIDGDYWHGNQWQRRGLSRLEEQFSNSENKQYWTHKIRRNMDRDCSATAALLSKGWKVLRFWESDVLGDVQRCVGMTLDALQQPAPNHELVLAQRTVAEFFSGIGLMRMGLERQGWSVRFANDIDPQKAALYRGQFSGSDQHLVVRDVHRLSVEEVPRVTLATASFPCNDLSLAGARGGLEGKHSSAFWGLIRLLGEMAENRPPLVLLENVPGFLTSHDGRDFKDALLALSSLGYAVDAFVLDAARFVPQSRARLFIVGILEPLTHKLSSPEPSLFCESPMRPRALANFVIQHPEIRWSLRRLPVPPTHERSLKSVLDKLPDDAPEWWSRDRAEYLYNRLSPRHKEIADEMISGHNWAYGTVFRRIRNSKSMAELRTDGIAGCLRTPRGGSARQILFKAGKGAYFARLLTPRECARLMGADDFHIGEKVQPNQALFGFGDAVCVPVVEWIAQHYLNPVISEALRNRPLSLKSVPVSA